MKGAIKGQIVELLVAAVEEARRKGRSEVRVEDARILSRPRPRRSACWRTPSQW